MTQEQQILNHLKTEPITPIEALEQYGCFRLAARIADLRRDGYEIHTEMVERGDKRWARYHLLSTEKRW